MLKRNETLIKTKLWQYLLPSILLTAALEIGNIVDTMLVGNLLGADAMSAVKIGMTFDNIMEIPGYVLGVGGSVAASVLLGKRELEKANKVFSVTFTISVILGLLFSILSPFSDIFATIATGGSELTDEVSAFIFVTFLCAPIISMALQFINYVAVDNNPSVASAYVIVSNVLNLTLDYLLIQYTTLGTAAAALSTALGYGLGMVVMLAYLKSPKRMLKFSNPFRNVGGALKLAIATGIPTLLYMIFVTVKDWGMNIMIIQVIGTDAMAVYTVCDSVVRILELLVGGIIGTVASIGGVIYGEKDYFGVKSLVKNVMTYSYGVLAVLMVVMLALAKYVVLLFGIKEGPLLELSITALRIFSFSLPFYLFNKFMTTYYQTTEQTKISGIITSLQNCIAIMPIAAVFVLGAKRLGLNSLNALMVSFILSEIATILIVSIYRMVKYKNQGLLLLPKREHEICFDISVDNDMEEARKVPREIIAFCKEHRVDAGKANLVAVAAEEIVINILKYGGKHARTVDVNLSVTSESIILRTRDNGIPFNPTEYTVDSDQFEVHGIEVIKSITDKIQYMRVLDLNNTVIEVSLQTV